MATVGQRIAQHRSAFGFSLAELAQLSGLSVDRLTALEADAGPTVYEVATLARSMAVEPKALLEGGDVDPKRSVARFRAPLGMSTISRGDMRLLAQGAEVGRIGAYLLRAVLDRTTTLAQHRRILHVQAHPAPWKQGYQLGEVARGKLIPGGDPIVSVQASLEEAGVHIAQVAFESEDIEAASLYEPGACPVILLNSSAQRVRRSISRRAVLAHELCHLLHDAGEADLLVSISRADAREPIEQRANGFGPSFLAPAASIRISGKSPREAVQDFAYAWGFTIEGAVWHLKNLKLIPDSDAVQLIAERRTATLQPSFERPIERISTFAICENDDVAPIARGLVSDLAMRAYQDGVITRGRACEIVTAR